MPERPDKETLQRLYLTERKSSVEIGAIYGVHSKSVRNWMHALGVPVMGNAYLKKGVPATWNVGRVRSAETRAKLSAALKGRVASNKGKGSVRFNCEACGIEVFDKPYRRRCTCSEACRNVIMTRPGSAHWNWKGGKKRKKTGPYRRPPKHGEVANYRKRECRCDLCAAAHEARVLDDRRRVKKWRIDNPEKCAATQKKNRARRRGAPGDYTHEDLARILKAQRYRCAYCRKSIRDKKSRHLDHIIALSKGGTNHLSNLQFCCVPCNSSKHNRDPIEFAQSRGLLC